MIKNTRENLLQISMQLFAVKGFNHTGIAEILAEAQVPKGSFYHYFKSKEDLGLAVIDTYGLQLMSGLEQVLNNVPGTQLQKLKAYFDGAVAYFETDPSLSLCNCLLGNMGQELALQSNPMREAVLRHYLLIEARFEECFRLAKLEGALAENADEKWLARLLFASWEGALVRARLARSSQPLSDLLALFFGNLLTG